MSSPNNPENRKILLIQPPIRDFYITEKRTLPYGLASIAASLKHKGFSVDLIDCLSVGKKKNIPLPNALSHLAPYFGKPDLSPFGLFHGFYHFGKSFEHIGVLAKESRAFLVGVSSLFTPYAGEALKTAETVRKALPEAVIVMGGHHASAFPDETLSSPFVDYVIRGDGETALAMLAGALLRNAGVLDVPGICFRRNDGARHISEEYAQIDPENIPFPDTGLFHRSFYRRKGKKSIVVTASRGCPLKCSYCALATSKIPFRKRSVSSVMAEIMKEAEHDALGFIDFEDENISLDKKWFTSLLKEIQRHLKGCDIELRAMNGLYPPSLDDELISDMKKAGFRTLNLSIGTFQKEMQKRFRRPAMHDELDRLLPAMQKEGLSAVCYVIAAAPGQPAKDTVMDLLHLLARRVVAGVSVYYPAPESVMFDELSFSGKLPPDFMLMRGTALPAPGPATKTDAATLMRLGRITNFITHLLDTKMILPFSEEGLRPENVAGLHEKPRDEIGLALLGAFLRDGVIRGIAPEGKVYPHEINKDLTNLFVSELKKRTRLF